MTPDAPLVASVDPLDSSDTDVRPPGVQRVVDFLEERGVWFVLSRNRQARSCRDAAHKRQRLGYVGIPLHDELKSFFGCLGETDRYVVAHCRGDRLLDVKALANALGTDAQPRRLTPGELEHLGLAYGLVNPFMPWALDGQLIASPVLQVFDDDLLRPVAPPGTVMTNAGDLTWAVEFRPADLVAALAPSSVVVAPIAMQDPATEGRRERAFTTIGIVTGNAPESGIVLWNRVNQRVRELLGDANYGDVSMPRVLVHSEPELGLSMELPERAQPVWQALERAAHGLCRHGADVVTVACNTSQYFAPRLQTLCAQYGARFVSLPHLVATWLRHHGVDRVALVGIEQVSDLGSWSGYREPFSTFTVERLGPRALARVLALAYQVKQEGPNETGLTLLRDILRQEVTSEHVVLALTELSLLMGRQRRAGRSGKVLIDPLAVCADALVAGFLGLPFPLPDHAAVPRPEREEAPCLPPEQ